MTDRHTTDEMKKAVSAWLAKLPEQPDTEAEVDGYGMLIAAVAYINGRRNANLSAAQVGDIGTVVILLSESKGEDRVKRLMSDVALAVFGDGDPEVKKVW